MNGPQLVEVAGAHLPKLSVGAFCELSERAWHDMRRQLLLDLEDARVGDAAKSEAMARHATRRGMPELVMFTAWKLDGAKTIIETAARAAGQSVCIDGLSPSEIVKAARALVYDEDKPESESGKALTTSP